MNGHLSPPVVADLTSCTTTATAISATTIIGVVGAARSGRTALLNALQFALARHNSAASICVAEYETIDEAAGTLDFALLMGLDWLPDPHSAAQDDAWRQALTGCGVRFEVIYGAGEQRLSNALTAIARHYNLDDLQGQPPISGAATKSTEDGQRRWTWRCEKCSDADCEHQLFEMLKRSKQAAAGDSQN